MNRAEVRRRQAAEVSNIVMMAAALMLGHQAGNNGTTYMAASVSVYMLMWFLVGGGLADTLGRLLRSRRNKGQYKNGEKMRKNAMICQLAFGFAGGLALFLLAGPVAEGVFKLRYCSPVIMAISPAIFFRALSSVFQGYFQGEGCEMPTAAAGILRPFLVLGLGFLLSGILGSYGDKAAGLLRQDNFSAMYRSTGIALAVSAAEILIALFWVLASKAGGFLKGNDRKEGCAADSSLDCAKYLFLGRWLQAAAACMAVLPLAAGLFFHVRRTEDEAALVLEYSMYAGKYLVLCAGAAALITVFVLPMTARIFAALRKNEHRFAKNIFQAGMHICVVNGIFASVYIAVMGEEIAKLLCGESAEALLPMLRAGSFVIAFAALAFYFARFLLTAGKKSPVLLAVGISDIIFTVTVAITGKAGILSLVYGSVAGIFMLCIVLGVFACGQLRIRVNWMEVIALPAAAGGAAGLAGMLVGGVLAPHMNGLVTLLVVLIIAGAVYWGVLVLLRNFKDQELEVMPGGRLVSGLKQKMHRD